MRTGSNWLADIFGKSSSDSSENFSASELLSNDPLIFYWRMIFLLEHIYNADEAVVETFKNIYNPNNFFLDARSNHIIKVKINKQKPYHKNLLKIFQKIIYEKKLNFVFKIFPEHLLNNGLVIDDIENMSDYIIINYRNDMLSSYISESKAMLSGRWSSTETTKEYQDRIYWNMDHYNSYVQYTLKEKISILENYFKQIKKPCIKISYESIHNHNCQIDKINFIRQQLMNVDKNFNWTFNENNIFAKQNNTKNIEDNFYNKDEFLRDLPSIKRFIYE
jgi:hypothetical protein